MNCASEYTFKFIDKSTYAVPKWERRVSTATHYERKFYLNTYNDRSNYLLFM